MAFSSVGTVSALLLLLTTLLLIDADYVTWAKCRRYGRRERVREYPTDNEATWLDLAGCRLKNITNTDFDGLPNVVFIWLQYNDIAHVDTTAFNSLPNVTKIELGNNKLNEAPVFVENSCSKLTELFLWNNQIKSINDAAFTACSKLERLYLSDNQIEHLPGDIFKSLPALKELYLYRNKINYIPDQMFASSTLQRLDLHGNKLTFLPANFIGNLPNLSIFDYSDNPWECNCLHELKMEIKRAPNQNLYQIDETDPECTNNTQQCRRIRPRGDETAAFSRLG